MLKAIPRPALGTRAAKKLRLQGFIPASLQGSGKPTLDFAIDEREFLALRRKHEHVFDFELAGGETETALVRELQWDTIGERILHVEFRRVARGEKTEAAVEIVFAGHPKGGVPIHTVTTVLIRALPADIPDYLEVKVEGLEPGHTLHASDIVLPKGLELAVEPGLAIANIAVPRGIEAPAEAAPAEAAAAQPAAAPKETPES